MKRIMRTLAVLVAITVMFPPAAALAHQGDPNYRSEINSITPAGLADGIELEVQNFDDHLELVNRTGKTLVVKGYDGEPYVRFSPDGLVEVNLNSPSHYLNEDRYANVELPDRADAEAEPEWEEVDRTGRFIWHDHRSHYMGVGLPSQVKDESQETEVFKYEIPMTVNGKPVTANGTLTWAGKDSGSPFVIWILLAGLIVAGAVGITLIRKKRETEDERSETDREDRDRKQTEAW